MDNYTLPHEELMKEENLTYKDVPSEIQEMLDEFKELKQDYEDLPSEEGLEVLLSESVIIADEIQDFLELELSDSDEEDDYNDGEEKNENKKGYQKSSFRFW